MFLPSVSGTDFRVILQFTAFPHPTTIDNRNNVWWRVPLLTVLIMALDAPSRMIPSLYELNTTNHAGTPPTHLVTFFNYTHTISIGWAVYSSPYGRVNRIINMIDDRMIDSLLISFCLFQYRQWLMGETDWPAHSSSTLRWSCKSTCTYDMGVPGHQSVRENNPRKSSSLDRYLLVHTVYNRTHTQYDIATVGTRTKPCYRRHLKHKPSTGRKFVILV